jgi:hypothetical protein
MVPFFSLNTVAAQRSIDSDLLKFDWWLFVGPYSVLSTVRPFRHLPSLKYTFRNFQKNDSITALTVA